MQLLIDAGADVNKGAYGWNDETPLHRACEEMQRVCAELLHDAGADDAAGDYKLMVNFVSSSRSSSIWQCSSCGNKNPNEHAFCTECFADKPAAAEEPAVPATSPTVTNGWDVNPIRAETANPYTQIPDRAAAADGARTGGLNEFDHNYDINDSLWAMGDDIKKPSSKRRNNVIYSDDDDSADVVNSRSGLPDSWRCMSCLTNNQLDHAFCTSCFADRPKPEAAEHPAAPEEEEEVAPPISQAAPPSVPADPRAELLTRFQNWDTNGSGSD